MGFTGRLITMVIRNMQDWHNATAQVQIEIDKLEKLTKD